MNSTKEAEIKRESSRLLKTSETSKRHFKCVSQKEYTGELCR